MKSIFGILFSAGCCYTSDGTTMKVLVLVISAFLSTNGIEDGIYRSNHEDGKYYPDDEGQYIPDYRGRYIYDPSGIYRHDGTGIYSDNDKGRYNEKLIKDFRKNTNTIPEESRQNKLIVKRVEKITPLKSEENAYKTIRQADDNLNLNGHHWKYEANNNIINGEKILNRRSNSESFDGKGLFRYNGPHNIVYSIIYTDI